jgi:hypothetical protein
LTQRRLSAIVGCAAALCSLVGVSLTAKETRRLRRAGAAQVVLFAVATDAEGRTSCTTTRTRVR